MNSKYRGMENNALPNNFLSSTALKDDLDLEIQTNVKDYIFSYNMQNKVIPLYTERKEQCRHLMSKTSFSKSSWNHKQFSVN